MVLDSGLPALRLAVRKARLAREAAWRDLLNTTSEIDDLDRRMASMPSDANPTFVQFFNEARTEATSANTAAQSAAQSAEAAADAADAAYDTAAAAEPPVWTGRPICPCCSCRYGSKRCSGRPTPARNYGSGCTRTTFTSMRTKPH